MSNSRNSVSRGINRLIIELLNRVRTGPGKPGILLWHFPEGDRKVLKQGY